MRQDLLMPLPDPEWLDVLRAEAAKPARTKQAIADELGVSRTAVSLLCGGKYSAKLDKVSRKIAGKVIALYANQRWCPHLNKAIGLADCDDHRTAPMTMSDPARLRQWAACRACPHHSQPAPNPVSNKVAPSAGRPTAPDAA